MSADARPKGETPTPGVARLLDQGEFDHVADLLRKAAHDIGIGHSAAWLSSSLRRLLVNELNAYVEANADSLHLPRVAAALRFSEVAGRMAFRLDHDAARAGAWFAQEANELRAAWLELILPGMQQRIGPVLAEIGQEQTQKRMVSLAKRPRKVFKSSAGVVLCARVIADRVKAAGDDVAFTEITIGVRVEFRNVKDGKAPSVTHCNDLLNEARAAGYLR